MNKGDGRSDEVGSGVVGLLNQSLMEALVAGRGMNDFLRRFLQAVGDAVGASRLVLYDYDEGADFFELLYFSGYPPDARGELTRRLHTMDTAKAITQQEPYESASVPRQVVVPLYFQQTLEALLMLEFPEPDGHRRMLATGVFNTVARFLGLFMSSVRLPVNQKMRLMEVTDMQRAREVQMAYLHATHPVTEWYEIYGYNQSSALVGGDYFDYFSPREKAVQCIVADACGHGLSAALIMSTFRGLLHSEISRIENLATLFSSLNNRLYVGGQLLQYLTAVFLDYDESARTLRYFNAGHFDPIVVHRDGTTSHLPGGGPPLGLFENHEYRMTEAAVQPGDLLVIFTDGLVELSDPSNRFFGVEGIVDSVIAKRVLPLPELASLVLKDASRFSQSRQPKDDLTLFFMRFR